VVVLMIRALSSEVVCKTELANSHIHKAAAKCNLTDLKHQNKINLITPYVPYERCGLVITALKFSGAVPKYHLSDCAMLGLNFRVCKTEIANSLVRTTPNSQFHRNGQLAHKLANSTIFHETGDNCLGVLVNFWVVWSLLYTNTSKN
jgi:hypothetical protein